MEPINRMGLRPRTESNITQASKAIGKKKAPKARSSQKIASVLFVKI